VVSEMGENCDALRLKWAVHTNFASQSEMPSALFIFTGCSLVSSCLVHRSQSKKRIRYIICLQVSFYSQDWRFYRQRLGTYGGGTGRTGFCSRGRKGPKTVRDEKNNYG
jgi:hypothetical protein